MQFSWKRIFKVVGVIVLAGIVTAGIYFIASLRVVKIAWASAIHDSREHYLPCEQLPFYEEVQKDFKVHQDVINQLQNLGGFNISAHEVDCPSSVSAFAFIKGDMEIDYHNRNQRFAIEKLIGDNFFGIPYRGYQR